MPDDPLVTAQLTGPAQLPANHIGQGVKPLNGEHRHGKPLVNNVVPAKMYQFVEENVLKHFLTVAALRQQYFRLQHAYQHWRFQIFGQQQPGLLPQALKLPGILPQQFLCHTAPRPHYKSPVAQQIPVKGADGPRRPEQGQQLLKGEPLHLFLSGIGGGGILFHKSFLHRFRFQGVGFPWGRWLRNGGRFRGGCLPGGRGHGPRQGHQKPQQHHQPGIIVKGVGKLFKHQLLSQKQQQCQRRAAQGQRQK